MTVRIATVGNADFVASGTWSDQPTRIGIFVGTNFMGFGTVTAPAALQSGDRYRVAAGQQYNLTFTPASLSAGDGDAALAAIMSAGVDEVTIQIALFDGAPGSTGSSNELTAGSNAGYARQTVTVTVTAV